MAKDFNSSARSGKTESLNDVLERIQHMRATQSKNVLMAEDWDWLVVLQCLQDNQLFKFNPRRPPLHAFAQWLRDNNVPQYIAHYSVRSMSYANTAIANSRYPWNDVQWNRNVLERWQILYRTLNSMLQNVTNGMK